MCENEATVHLSQIDDEGKIKKIDLCEECARAEGVNDENFSLANLLVSLGNATEEASTKDNQVSCATCGYSQTKFKKTGRVGCPSCYDYIVPDLERMLSGMHRDTIHQGKCPQAVERQILRDRRLMQLKRELGQCVEEERYEEAARLRDEIKAAEALESSESASLNR